MAMPRHAVNKGMALFVRQRIAAPLLGMKVASIGGHIRQCIRDLIEKPPHLFSAEIFDCNPRVFAKRHFPVTVEAARWVDADRQRRNVAAFNPAIAEKVADGNFNRRRVFIVRIKSKDGAPPAHAASCRR
jgi:hypothetical protein